VEREENENHPQRNIGFIVHTFPMVDITLGTHANQKGCMKNIMEVQR